MIQLPLTPETRGQLIKKIVDNVESNLNAAGVYYAYQHRPLIAVAIADVLFGSASVDLPTWKEGTR